MLQIRRIIQLKTHGKSNREIASELDVSRDTVNGYVKLLNRLDKSHEQLLILSEQELSSLMYNELPVAKQNWRYTDLQQRIPSLCDELKVK